ncbi:MAG: AMP-binding protein [Desulfobacterales bacterium]|nr:AMP-binding protein [Desulfobacterales bacterium]
MERPWLKSYPAGLPSDIEIPDVSLGQAFDEAAEKWRDRTALIFYGKKMSYRALKNLVDRFATALHNLGVRKGDRVALFLLNCPQFIIAYFGALKIGAVLTPISPVFVTSEVKHQLEDSQSETIVCQDILYDFVEKTGIGLKRIILTGIGEYLPGLKKFIGKSFLRIAYQRMEIPDVKIKERENIYWFQSLIEKSRPDPPKVDIQPDQDLASVSYTAGTTGPPKGAMLTHTNLMAMQAICGTFWAYTFQKGKNLEEGKEIAMASFPFYHMYGQAHLVVSGCIRGYTLVVLTTPDLDDILDGVGRYGVTFLMGVPSLYGLLADYEKTDRIDWKGLKLAFSCADTLSEGTAKGWERRTGAGIHEGYGLTETAPAVCINPSGRSKVGSVGVPLPNTMAAIAHPEKGGFMAPGEIGELVVRGPQVMKGYWNRPEGTGQSFAEIMGEKWLRTGDLARIDDEGYFYFYDRKRDLIKYQGHSIFAREIEEVLKTHPKVKEAAVIGAPDPEAGEKIKAVIVLQTDARGKLSEEEIGQYCRQKLDDYKIPQIVEFRRELPRTDVGKVSRRELREEREG